MVQPILWLLLALLHAMPAIAAFRPSLLTKLYGVSSGGEMFVLLHHRAALFVVVVIICLWAAIDPGVRRLATVALAVSMGSFLLIYWQAGNPAGLRSIAIADLIGAPVLVSAAYLAWTAQ